MKYAVIQLGGKQYKVVEGETLTVNSLEGKEGEKIELSDVLLIADDKKLTIGSPLVKGARITVEVVSHQKGDKIRVAKYKAKSRYRRVKGHRQQETSVKIISIK